MYDHLDIEKKWQKEWSKKKIYKTLDSSSKPKYYILDMFPYPSGEGLHVGHPKGYIATDIISRLKRMQGFNVLHPMGFDAFGLPAENYAIKTKTHPIAAVKKNVARFKEQLEIIGLDYDWSREINTTDPKFYKWTQWIFEKLYEKGLAYESYEPINWCPVDKTGLANEDVEDGKCERCGAVVEKKPMRQWVLKITDYTDRMLEDLDQLDWPEHIKEAQRNWIGRSEGVEIDFRIKNSDKKIKVFTTRPETIFGVTYIAISNDHELAKENLVAINPINDEEVPVFVADYVLSDYGTGAVMGVPAHDERDLEFARKNNIEIKQIEIDMSQKDSIIEKVNGKKVIRYKLRDWVFSRQRYWGEPFPILRDENGEVSLVPEKDLPVILPNVKSYEPSDTGESPLVNIKKWMQVKIGKKSFTRESNTMPQWAGSSWYYLRFMDPKNDKKLVDSKKEEYWNQVDFYVGGAEHATRHLIYARFWHKFLYDIGVVSTKEPFKKLQSVGLIMGEDGKKMSKRFGNIVNPDEIVKKYGADTLRLYEMFMGPFENSIAWNTDGIMGTRRFLEKVWRLKENLVAINNPETDKILHKTIRKVGEDIENMKFNTAISAMMIASNEIKEFSRGQYLNFLQILAPFAPHMTEEIWKSLGNKKSIHISEWPKYDPGLIVDDEVNIPVQINGKLRVVIKLKKGLSNEEVERKVRELAEIRDKLHNENIVKVIVVKDKLINFVVKQ